VPELAAEKPDEEKKLDNEKNPELAAEKPDEEKKLDNEKDPEINVPSKDNKSTESSSDSDSDSDLSSESDVDIGDDEHPEHRSLCCKCCQLKFQGTIKMINWPFLICMTLATVLAGMSIGSALFNDGPIANIIQER